MTNYQRAKYIFECEERKQLTKLVTGKIFDITVSTIIDGNRIYKLQLLDGTVLEVENKELNDYIGMVILSCKGKYIDPIDHLNYLVDRYF